MQTPKDMTGPQFAAALRRNGFRKVLLWIEDISGACPGVSWGVVMNVRTGKVMRRATLAKVIQAREGEIAKRQKGAA
jgi:hypothetical protein